MNGPHIAIDDTVEQAVARFPALAAVFVRLGMACVGCDMAVFDTVRDAAAAYDQEPAELLAELNRAAAAELGP
jgi:hybrid cluster-associated redox disulfide protein